MRCFTTANENYTVSLAAEKNGFIYVRGIMGYATYLFLRLNTILYIYESNGKRKHTNLLLHFNI